MHVRARFESLNLQAPNPWSVQPCSMGIKGEHGSSKRRETQSKDMMSLLGLAHAFSTKKGGQNASSSTSMEQRLGGCDVISKANSRRRMPAPNFSYFSERNNKRHAGPTERQQGPGPPKLLLQVAQGKICLGTSCESPQEFPTHVFLVGLPTSQGVLRCEQEAPFFSPTFRKRSHLFSAETSFRPFSPTSWS